MQETAPHSASTDVRGSCPGDEQSLLDDLRAQLARATTALSDAEARHRSTLATLAGQLADQKTAYELALTRNAAIWEMVDEQLREAALEIERARLSQASSAADAERATRRALELETRIAEEIQARSELEQALARAVRAQADAESQHASAMAEAAAKSDELAFALQRANAECEARTSEVQRLAMHEADLTARLAEAVTQRTTIERQLHATQAAIQEADARATRERLAASRKAADREAELDGRLRQEQEARSALERAVAEAEAAARDEQEQHQRALTAAAAELAEIQARLACELSEAREARDAAAEQLRLERERISGFEADLGTLRHAVAAAEEQAHRAAAERAALGQQLDETTRRLEAAERDASQLPRLRERLELAHRMEAIGRLASEAAATCGNLLAGVHENVHQWLVTSNGDAPIRQRGEAVLDDVTRAAGLIRRLAGYAEEQGRSHASADLGALVRDLESVLRRVAGQDVEVVLSEAASPLRLDVGSERVERLLVSLASYGRERMPDGGRAKIEIGTVVVDSDFTARHPNVRAGAHALITVTKSRPQGNDQSDDPRHGGAGQRPQGRSGRTPGVELETLQGLVGECGGHLWMTIEPQGDLVSRLHLPLVRQ
jgi:chromosome segregation ATPase